MESTLRTLRNTLQKHCDMIAYHQKFEYIRRLDTLEEYKDKLCDKLDKADAEDKPWLSKIIALTEIPTDSVDRLDVKCINELCEEIDVELRKPNPTPERKPWYDAMPPEDMIDKDKTLQLLRVLVRIVRTDFEQK